MERRVIVYPPAGSGGRRVVCDGVILGLARGPRDVLDLLRQAGLRPRARDLFQGDLIEWRGGGPDVWA
jgi:hypothetical protein